MLVKTICIKQSSWWHMDHAWERKIYTKSAKGYMVLNLKGESIKAEFFTIMYK